MNNRVLVTILSLFVFFLIYSCKEDADDEININGNSTIAELGFNDESNLDDWYFTSNESAVLKIDNDEKTEGSGSLKIENGCSSIKHQNAFTVEKDANYKIKFHTKYEELPEGSYCGGAYELAFVVIQGNESEWYSLSRVNSDWLENELYYHADDTGLPIQLRIYCGVQNFWIDQLSIEKQ